jgi:hypothetical protein
VKVLTLTQPFASLVANGSKRIETRSWSTRYRGPLAIHAAKGFPKVRETLVLTEPFHSCLWPADDIDAFSSVDLPTGVILATCRLVDCMAMEDSREFPFYCFGFDINPSQSNAVLTEQERVFGHYEMGRFAWMLEDIRPLEIPIPAKGALGLWDFPVEVAA